MGPAARRALSAGPGGRVFAVFRRSLYCQDGAGRLACVGPASIGAGPLNALCDLPEELSLEREGLRVGARVERDGAVLRIERLRFSLAEARTWVPAPVPRGWKPVTLVQGLDALAAVTAARRPREGFAPFVTALASGRDPCADPPPAGLSLGAALKPIAALVRWLRMALAQPAAGAPAPPSGAASLIGLGPGLTPAGDDFLGGSLIGLRALGRGDIASALAAWLLPLANERTHPISVAHLACAAEGQAMSALHRTLAVLCAPGGPGLDECLDAIAAIGHSSGWDALAGAAVAARLVSESR